MSANSMPRDYYDVLGVQRGADETEIKKAFRRLARELGIEVSVPRGYALMGDEKLLPLASVGFEKGSASIQIFTLRHAEAAPEDSAPAWAGALANLAAVGSPFRL